MAEEYDVQKFEVQLAGWQKSDSHGRPPMVKFIFQSDEDVEYFAQFTAAKGSGKNHVNGQIFDIGVIISDQDGQSGVDLSQQEPVGEQAKGDYGWVAHLLHKQGFFRAPPVWQALGTDDEFREWVQLQPCIISGSADWVELTPGGGLEPRCEACHVRRSGEFGTGYKADYACVPMKHEYHAQQHKLGETYAYNEYLHNQNRIDGIVTEQTAKDWFDKKRLETVEAWAHHRLCEAFDVNSLTLVSPDKLVEYCEFLGLLNYLPSKIKEAARGRV